MEPIIIEKFAGAIPLYDKRQLPTGVASSAVNCRFERGSIEALYEPESIQTLSSTTHNINHHRAITVELGATSSFVQSPTKDSSDRFYFTDGTVPKKSSSTLYPSWRKIGVPAPNDPITASGSHLSGTSIIDSVSYIYTYVTDWGEESAPSPQSAVFEVYDTMAVTLSNMSNGNIPDSGITKKRIYRASAGTKAAEFQFVAEIPSSQTTYEDTVAKADLGEICVTEDWIGPPDDIKGLIYIGNGCIAGFSGNTVYISDPFVPYAFPLRNQFSITDTIVGLGHFGQTLVVLTTGQPALLNGSDPRSMTQENLPDMYPCVSAASIVSTAGQVFFASHDGLYICSSKGIGKVTRLIFREDDWTALNPSTIIGIAYNDMYYGLFAGTSKGFVIDIGGTEMADDNVTTVVMLDFAQVTMSIRGCMVSSRDSRMYFVAEDTSTGVVTLFRYNTGVNKLTAVWESGEVYIGRRGNVGAAHIEGIGDYTLSVSSDSASYTATGDQTIRLAATTKVDELSFKLTGFNVIRGVYLCANIKSFMFPLQKDEGE